MRVDCAGLTWLHVFLATWARSLAIRIPLESVLPRTYSCCSNPRHLIAELSKWPNSSTRHFTSTVPLFDTSYIFDARHGGLFRPKLNTNGLSWQTISWYYPFNIIVKLHLFVPICGKAALCTVPWNTFANWLTHFQSACPRRASIFSLPGPSTCTLPIPESQCQVS
jgi:hypothetical protein